MSQLFGPIKTVILFGSGTVLTRLLDELAGKKTICVVTGERLAQSPSHERGMSLQEFVAARGVMFDVCEDVNTHPLPSSWLGPATLGISFGAPWIFRARLIAQFGGKLVNAHHAPLPRGRGGGGFSWQILQSDRAGGCVIHQVTTGIDDGPILKLRKYRFPRSCKVPAEFDVYASDQMYRLVSEFVREIERGARFEPAAQREATSTYWPRLCTDLHGFIDWSWGVRDLVAFIDAFDRPYPGASTFWNGARVRVRDARALRRAEGRRHPFQRGLVYRRTSAGLHVAAQGGSLVIGSVVSDEAGDVTSRIKIGDRLSTPQERLEAALWTRVAYTASGMTTREDLAVEPAVGGMGIGLRS